MKNDPFVDVIMPNYNKGEFLEESIDSVLAQEYKNWNLFVIDNSSNDNSKEILNKFQVEKSNINIIYLSKNKGAAFSRNLGIRLSKAEYISFIDSDDYWSSDKLKDQISFMQKFNHIFTYTDYTPFVLKNNNKVFKREVISPNTFTYDQFINDTTIATSSMIIKRSFVSITKFAKVNSFEDYPFKCKILKKGCTAIKLKKNSMFYRITKNSLSSNKYKSLYWLWYINKRYNKLSFVKNIKSILLISLNSIKKYGLK